MMVPRCAKDYSEEITGRRLILEEKRSPEIRRTGSAGLPPALTDAPPGFFALISRGAVD